jgi:hypothetical protein
MTTAKFGLAEMAVDQASKYLTYNEGLNDSLALAHAVVLDRDLTAPPGSPAEGDTYLVAAAATGAWTGWDGRMAYFYNGAWRSIVLEQDYLVYIVDETLEYRIP